MCGIAGFLGRPAGLLPPWLVLERMVSAVGHRGQDDRGIHVDEPVGLGHARLSIVDLAGGRQPMLSADGDLAIVFNGEIFNHVELRTELMARGRRFRTASDTEVILHLYEERGLDCVQSFNGDFAFALWDRRRKRLMLARDRAGVRPLFYSNTASGFVFASEVKALLAHPAVSAELDPRALDQIFTFWAPLSPRTAFKNIVEVPPGHVLTATAEGIMLRAYWRLQFPDADDASAHDTRDEHDIAAELRHLLTDATRIRLRADVPVGSYLSGGLDSSIVTALAKRLAPARLSSFSVAFEAAEFDESAHQEAMVRALGTEHRAITCSSADIAQVFPEVIRHTERPLLRTAPAPLFALSRLVRDSGFKVVLTGEGADEALAGYDIFKEAKVRRFCARFPASSYRTQLFGRLYPYLPGLQSQPASYLNAFFGVRPDDLGDPLFSHLPRFRSTTQLKTFFSADLRAALRDSEPVTELRESLPPEFARWHPLSQAQYLETAHLLPGYILSSQGDRVAMAHGIEGRFPFLDHRILAFAARLPPRMKLRGLREKHILRECAKDLLPAAIGARTKQPYRAPDAAAFLGPEAPAYVEELLSPAALADTGLFDPSAVARLVGKCKRNSSVSARDGMALTGILSTQLWAYTFLRCAAEAGYTPAPSARETLSLGLEQ